MQHMITGAGVAFDERVQASLLMFVQSLKTSGGCGTAAYDGSALPYI